MIELTVTIKGEDASFKKDFLIYEDVCLKFDDPEIMRCVKEATSHVHFEPESVKIRAKMEL